MTKIVLYMAQTVNGYIARENDDTPWSNAVWKSYYKIARRYKAAIFGRRTYQIMKEVNEFEKIGNPFTIVVTHKTVSSNNKKFAFVKAPEDAIKLLRGKKFKEALLGGGSRLNASFLREGLIDEIYLDVESSVFGKGIPLFGRENFEAKLKLLGIKKLSKNLVQLHYKVL